MNIVVSNSSKLDCVGFLKLDSLQKVVETRGVIDFLVYNKSGEDTEDIVIYLNEVKDRVGKIIYVCNEKDTDPVVKMLVIGMGGNYFDDEFFLEVPSELSNLVNSLEEVTEIAEMGGVSVLSDFLNRYLKNGSTSFTQRYLVSVKEAVQSLMEEYNKKNVELLEMSETATELFSNTTEVLTGMRKEYGELQKSILKLEKEIKKDSTVLQVPSNPSRSPYMLFFPQVSYMKNKKIIRVKEIGSVRYLFSFMLGFRLYLENVMNVRPKLLVIESIGDVRESHYSEWNWVTKNTAKEKRLYYDNIVFTNYPNKEVLFNMLEDDDYDTFIVLDRSFGSKNHVLNSKGSLFFAVSGNSYVSDYKLNVHNCFTSCGGVTGVLFDIPCWNDYPSEKSFRERRYMNDMGSYYSMLSN